MERTVVHAAFNKLISLDALIIILFTAWPGIALVKDARARALD